MKEGQMIDSKEALQKLIEGNNRFVAQKSIHPNQTPERWTELLDGQKPFAVVIGCSDSRVPPEIIFDQGLGDLFIIRVAGNILDDIVIGSIEYAVAHLEIKLIVVLGHTKCGAITAIIQGDEAIGHTKSLVEAIKPAVKKAKNMEGDLLDNAIKINVDMVVNQLKESKPILAKTEGLEIRGAIYNLDSGKVNF